MVSSAFFSVSRAMSRSASAASIAPRVTPLSKMFQLTPTEADTSAFVS